MIADTAASFADAVARLLANDDLRAHLGANARQFVLQRFGAELMERAINQVVCGL